MYLRNELRAHAAVYKAIKALPGGAHSKLVLLSPAQCSLCVRLSSFYHF
jgi:hypothetical protein